MIARKAPRGTISRVQFSQAGGGVALLSVRFIVTKHIPEAGPGEHLGKIRVA